MNENQFPDSTTPNSQPLVLTVSQITNAIKHSLESTFPLVWLQGEISNFKPNTSGHIYFSLKDANSQISAVMFRQDAQNVKFPIKDGTQVIVRGEINVYPAGGRYQILVREMKPVGIGELLLKLEELKAKIHKLGWFKAEHKKPLPKFPKRIGIVTSPTGAVIQDILNVLTRRFSGFHVILNPVKVQGEGAAKEIAQAIDQFNQYELVDVMIVGRGGGSIEDLWAFNEEIVAEAIFKSHIPIISAVGHETDHCIADYVADVRAPTPSAAAEIVIGEKAQQLKHLSVLKQRLEQTLTAQVRQDKHRLEAIKRQPLFQSPYYLLGPSIQRLDDCRQDLSNAMTQQFKQKRMQLESYKAVLTSLRPTARLEHYRQTLNNFEKNLFVSLSNKLKQSRTALQHFSNRLDNDCKATLLSKKTLFNKTTLEKQLDLSLSRIIRPKKDKLQHMIEALHAVNPKNVLQKGYCILFKDEENKAIASIQDVNIGDSLHVLMNDGQLTTVVKSKSHN